MSRRDIPSVDRLAASLPADIPQRIAVSLARDAIDRARRHIDESTSPSDTTAIVEREVAALANRWASGRPRRVLNGTGVLLHTNLGRAPLHPEAVAAASAAASGYTNLEIDMDDGGRGNRSTHLMDQLTSLVECESAIVVNNNAAALLLTLAALAHGRSVPVSRGEMIEIGGSYRLPELMAASGAHMVEVGTTNRTRVDDHAAAIDDGTGLLLSVHPSNYRITGFTESARLEELASLGRDHGLPVVFDLGSGLIDERVPWIDGPAPGWLRSEPGVTQSLRRGADLVLFSGDKLLGGPQAGIGVGRADLISELRSHPMARAMRVDGSTVAALSATLDLYLDGRTHEIPFWRMAMASSETLRRRARAVLDESRVEAAIVATDSTVGAGSVPGSTVPSVAIAFDDDIDRLHDAFLAHPAALVARRSEGRLLIDLRSIAPDDDDSLIAALRDTCR